MPSKERGSVLIACIVIALLFMSLTLWYGQMMHYRVRARVYRSTAQSALDYADDGIADANVHLKDPTLKTFLPIGATAQYSLDKVNGRVDISLYRQSTDANLVDLYATGYYNIPRGSLTDPLTGNPVQIAVINAKYRVTNVAQFVVAVPGTLPIGYGTNAAAGTVYGSDLQFATCTAPCGPQTSLASAMYFQSVNPPNYLSFVTITQAPSAAVRLAYPMNFASLDPVERQFYQTRALPSPPPAFQGTVSAPLPSHVYFVSGDLHIGGASPLTVDGVYAVYVTGSVFIHNSIVPANPSSWIAILSESDIHLAADAPNNLTITGNFICNGIFTGDMLQPGNLPRTGVNFTLNGGIVTMSRMDIASSWQGVRTYAFQSSNDPNLLLPNLSQPLEYKVLSGKYR